MLHRVLSAFGGLCAAISLFAYAVPLTSPALAQGADAKAVDNHASAAHSPAAQQVDEYAEAQRILGGPAGNPECVWLGRRVVSLLWRDDLETAFRHLDLYDRFGCPGGHIQAAFRCLILNASSIDPKAPDSLNGRVKACWLNPIKPAPPPAPAASAAPSKETTKR
jgi:hypothetical protein